ncbi:diguanylate cyclase/phosphodiesterase [Paraglaciecola sp. T6c]|uniref:putative bifunctional diguanylate cyclase/phosphodiesterase n=1 Tax=Pseudoalteromonas atlantica (strain T6c / ATCC BAA-1087) TaxID=3042615 RepID=UPI00005C5438|nr:EAL domain-containing protein [Paraglaciecola sp. T6c]ABG42613.1 diguanylate cyclase/phosphodiesterase [Paraglaciecola sp. T6c]
MLFRTIKNTTTMLTVVAIVIVCAAVVASSVEEYEQLYLEATRADLDGLSENLASDLVPLIASDPDIFEVTTTLLRLDRYENVKYAVVFDENWQRINVYFGSMSVPEELDSAINTNELRLQPHGVYVKDGELIALKLVGDARLPLGHLLIVNDSSGPLYSSKLTLLKRVLPLVFLVLFVAIVGSLFVQRQLFLPLSRLSRVAKRIQDTHDYSLRIDTRGKQEVAELSRDINSMMETINAETQKNAKYTEQLKEQQKAMERLANFDGLTGLPNRQFFMETLRLELAKAKRDERNLVLMYFDLDGFKGVNDSFGHEIGDLVLMEVCRRTKSILRDGDLISRLGGDEFLILLHNEPNDLELYEISERLVSGLNMPFEIQSWEVQVGVSIGIARASDSNFNVSEFVSNADIAMYRSKLAGRSTHTVFVPEMMEDNKRRLLIANSIANAIKFNEFSIHYQGKVDADENIVGYEALIRWKSDELGFVSPAEFIPIAEQSGKILSITKWVIKRVCQELQQVHALHKNEIVVSINLSAHDIKNTALVDYIRGMFTRYNVDNASIEFEVTESAYLENFDVANHFLTQLREMGCSIALDDFGAGYSSLGYLTQIELNTLKIDKQFVDNLNMSKRSTLVTKTIIEMAKQLNLKICAEGVETREQAEFLIENGCHQLQGYLFSKPKSLLEMLSV